MIKYYSQTPILKSRSAEDKLTQALRLYHSALQLKIAALRQFYPQLSEQEIEDKAKRIFFNAK